MGLRWVCLLSMMVSLRAGAQVQVPAEMRNLPSSVVNWWIYETYYASTEADPIYFGHLDQTDVGFRYRPEAHQVFDVTGYWLPEKKLHTFSDQLPEAIRELTQRLNPHTGEREVLYFVHPESEALFPEIVGNRELERSVFKAVATSSTRGLLLWKPGAEHSPFVGKLSLNREVAELLRTVSGFETQFSVQASGILREVDFPEGSSFMREVFGAVVRGHPEGGMILRALPEGVLSGQLTLAPLFALYGGANEIEKGSLLLRLIRASGLQPLDFVRTRLVRPFVRAWVRLARQGIVMEPHAQNVLVALSMVEDVIARLEFRDLGGFAFDPQYREAKGLPVPRSSPDPDLMGPSGEAGKHATYLFKSLERKFLRGFLYGIESVFAEWRKDRVFAKELVPSWWAAEMLAQEVSAEISLQLGREVKVRSDFKDIAQKVSLLQKAGAVGPGLCLNVFE